MTTDAPYRVRGSITTAGAGTTATTNVVCPCTNAGEPVGAVVALLTGTFTGATLVAEGDVLGDGATWVALEFHAVPGGAATATVSPTSGTPVAYQIPHSGMAQIRVRASALSTGSVVVDFNASMTANEFGAAGSGTVTANLGTISTAATAAAQTTAQTSLTAIASSVASGSTSAKQDTLATAVAFLQEPTTSTAITPSDATALAFTKGVYVGVGGDVAGRLSGDAASQVWKNVPSGTRLPGSWARLDSTNTTATNILGLS